MILIAIVMYNKVNKYAVPSEFTLPNDANAARAAKSVRR